MYARSCVECGETTDVDGDLEAVCNDPDETNKDDGPEDDLSKDDEPCKCENGCSNGSIVPNDKVGNPVSVLSGNNVETETDLVFNSPHEKGFKFYRAYRSRSTLESQLGYGWTHNYNVTISFLDSETTTYQIRDEAGKLHYYEYDEDEDLYVPTNYTNGDLVEESDGSVTWYRANGITYYFNSALLFIGKVDTIGNVQSLTYNDDGLLESVLDESTGRSIGFEYNDDGYIDYITGPVTDSVADGVWVSYEYDGSGNLTGVTFADDGNGSGSSGFVYSYDDENDANNMTGKSNLAGEVLSSWAYDSSDRAYENITRDGKGVEITYDTDQVVVTDAQGSEKIYTLDTINGRNVITDITGEDGCASCGGGIVRYGYDDEKRVNEVEYSNGRIDTFSDFDDNNRYQTKIQALGTTNQRTILYTYHPDTEDYLSITEESVWGTGNKTTVFDYDDDGDDTPNEDPTPLMYRKIESGYTYDSVESILPYEYITEYTYDSAGRVTEIDGPLDGDSDTVSFTYDSVTGDLLTETLPLLGTISYTYDAAGNVLTVTEPDGTVTSYTYDGRNRVTSTTRNGISISSTYTAAGEIDSISDALDRTLDYTYNSTGFLESIVDPSGNFNYYGYSSIGLQTESSIYASDSTQVYYSDINFGDPSDNDDLVSGKPWKLIRRNADDTDDLETVYAYDSSGNVTSVTDANGNITQYEYDLFNRLVEVIQPGDISTTYTYDSQGNLTGVTDAEGHLTLYAYDDMSRLVSEDSQDTGITLYSYDEAGNLIYKIRNDNVVEYQYDVLGRITDTLYSDATQDVAVTYDSGSGSNLLGRVASVSDPSGLVEYSYDVDGNIVSETRTINSVSFVTDYDYDDAGNIRGIVYPTGHVIEYEVDATDPALVSGIILNPSGTNQILASGIAYKPFGPVDAMTLGNGITVSKTFDKSYQLLSLSSGTVLGRSYGQDNVGNIETITDNLDSTLSQSFDYDDLYRLTNAEGSYGTIAYTYDDVGNRLTRIRTGGTESEDTYYYNEDTNLLNIVVGTNAEMIEYDTDGNTLQRILGPSNPKTAISDPADYIYNNAGQRIIKDATTDVIYHYDLSGQLIAETDNSGIMLKAYVWFANQPLAMIAPDGSIYYFHNDHLGTPQKLTDSTGAIVWAADYLPFGQADVSIATIDNNLRFAGQYYDNETGLHYNYHRYYDPKIGRYLRADPIGLAGGINPYTYSLNNPVNNTDTFGLFIDGGVLSGPAAYFLVTATAGLILYYGAPVAADIGKWLRHQLWNENTENSDSDACPKRGVGGKGWRGDKNWRDQVRDVESGGDVDIDPTPNVDEAKDLIDAAGGTVDRVDSDGHAPGGVSEHIYPHINYTTASKRKGTIKIK